MSGDLRFDVLYDMMLLKVSDLLREWVSSHSFQLQTPV